MTDFCIIPYATLEFAAKPITRPSHSPAAEARELPPGTLSHTSSMYMTVHVAFMGVDACRILDVFPALGGVGHF